MVRVLGERPEAFELLPVRLGKADEEVYHNYRSSGMVKETLVDLASTCQVPIFVPWRLAYIYGATI